MSDAPEQPEQNGDDSADTAGKDAAAKNGKARKISPRTKLILFVLLAVVVVAVAIWFIHHETRGKFYEATDDATIQADAVAVSPKISGYVGEVLVTDNQDVKAGQPLVRIDPRTYQAQAAQAEAQIAVANAGVESAQASILEQRAAIDQARAQLAQAQTKAAHDNAEVARYEPLAASGAESKEQLAQLRSTARQSNDTVRAQAAALAAQERKIASYQAQIHQAEAQGAGAKAQLQSANVDVGSAVLRAPFDGRIGNKTVQVGQFAQPGTRLMSVVPLNKIYVTANFKETQLALMRAGQPATIEVDALDGIKLHGHVGSVSPGTGAQFSLLPPQNATGNFTKIVQRVPVRIEIEATADARKLLVPGLSVNVTVDTINAKGELDKIQQQQKQLAQQQGH